MEGPRLHHAAKLIYTNLIILGPTTAYLLVFVLCSLFAASTALYFKSALSFLASFFLTTYFLVFFQLQSVYATSKLVAKIKSYEKTSYRDLLPERGQIMSFASLSLFYTLIVTLTWPTIILPAGFGLLFFFYPHFMSAGKTVFFLRRNPQTALILFSFYLACLFVSVMGFLIPAFFLFPWVFTVCALYVKQ